MKIFNIRSVLLMIFILLSAGLYVFTEARYALLVLILLLLILIGAVAIILIQCKGLSIWMQAESQSDSGNPVNVEIKAKNTSAMPVLFCDIQMTMQNLLTSEMDNFTQSLSLGPNKEKTLGFKINEKRCGCIRISINGAKIADPLKIFGKEIKNLDFARGRNVDISYLPQMTELGLDVDGIETFNMESNKFSVQAKGSDPSETFDIRDYEIGDSLKSIHWKLSSKLDKIMIREHSLPIENKVMLLVDKNRKLDAYESIDFETKFITTLSSMLLGEEIYHSIGWYNHLTKDFEMCRVDTEESFWQAIEKLISCPYDESQESAVESFIKVGNAGEFSSFIYITDEGKDVERLMGYGTVTQYRTEEFRN